ncbi:MAG: hypothetical protein M0007_03770 [Actinomycetota bacterium]|nr:hypothetical protein [Actinomycetota bacterium]
MRIRLVERSSLNTRNLAKDRPDPLIRAFVRLCTACATALNCSISSTLRGSGTGI